jgi:hypothetical protein
VPVLSTKIFYKAICKAASGVIFPQNLEKVDQTIAPKLHQNHLKATPNGSTTSKKVSRNQGVKIAGGYYRGALGAGAPGTIADW